MKKYRMELDIKGLPHHIEKYFAVEDEQNAKKWFLINVYKEMRTEGWEYDRISVSQDVSTIQAYYKSDLYLTAKLYCVPEQCPRINIEKIRDYKIEDIIKTIGKNHRVSRTVGRL